ncbi:MAG: hypothetical protein JNJ57_12045, partial [Saprospiraceae bacterium]|nr:hypothetical protein [Saprospiraceae bacterium]
MKINVLTTLTVICLAALFMHCDEPCENRDVPVAVQKIEWTQLDTRNSSPVVLQPGEAGYKNGYGFQLTGTSAIQDTVGAQSECAYLVLSPRISNLDIVTLTGMGASNPPGSSVTTRFKYFAGTGAADASGAAAYLSAIWGIPGASGCIFLLTTPPVDTGWQQLEI